MTYTATFTNPAQNYAGVGDISVVPIFDFVKMDAFNMVSACVLSVRTEVLSKFSVETDDDNPLQQNSTLDLRKDGSIFFRGYVIEKPVTKQHQGGAFIPVTCYGWDGILLKAFCLDPFGNDVWKMETDSKVATQLPLKVTSNYGSFQGDTLWPDPLDGGAVLAYIKDSESKSDALQTNIGIGTYVISGVNQGTKTFTVNGTVGAEFNFNNANNSGVDARMTVDSGPNAGEYTIVSASELIGTTSIIVNESIPSPTPTGNVVNEVIILGTDYKGFVPRGWMKIGTEWLYFDGYDDADDGPGASGIHYRLRNVKRGELQTIATAYIATAQGLFRDTD